MTHATSFAWGRCAVKMVHVARTGLWGGRTIEQRRADRRARMIGAAIAIWSQHGWATVTMRRICAETSLNDRYFTDEFGDRDGLLVAAWDSIKDNALSTIAAAYALWDENTSWEELTRQVATEIIDWMTVQPAYARILLSRNEGSPALEEHRREALHRAIDLVIGAATPRLRPGYDVQAVKMNAVAGVGAFIELLRSWQSGYLEVDAAQIVDHTAAAAALVSGRVPTRETPVERK